MHILIAGDFRYNSGSSHAVFNYHRVAEDHGCQIKISAEYGSLDAHIQKYIPICADATWADHLILVFEANQYLSREQVLKLQQLFPRERITVIDPDGRYGSTIYVKGNSNHARYCGASWKELYDALSDRILQPRLSPLPQGTQFFPYFGMECMPHKALEPANKIYTIQYVGNNWYRWEGVKAFLSQLQTMRSRVGRIALKGKWWDGETKPGLEEHTYAEADFLRALDVETEYSVPFGTVISAMSEAMISPIFVRPMISAQRLLTPRMLETLSADTIPIFGKDVGYIIRLYGCEANALCFEDNIAEKVQDMLGDPAVYFELIHSIRQRVYPQYNYHSLFSTLLQLICC